MFIKTRKNVYIPMALAFFVVSNLTAEHAPDWVPVLHEAHKTKDMTYRLMCHINFESNQKHPVIVSLHSAPAKGTNTIKNV